MRRAGRSARRRGLTAHIVGLAGVYDIIDRDETDAVVLHYVLATYFGRVGDGTPKAGRRRA